MKGHALLPPEAGEPFRCACGVQYDWRRSEDYPGGVTRDEARRMHRTHRAAIAKAKGDGDG